MREAILYKPCKKGGARQPVPISEDKEFTIGRAYNASLDVPLFEVSRLHCKIVNIDSQWMICDKSSYGTYLNGNRLQKDEATVLSDGDKITLSVLKDSYIFCSNGKNCRNNCKDVETEEIVIDDNDDKRIKLQDSIRKSKHGMEELKILQTNLNQKFTSQLNGLQEKFQEQLKSQTPEQVKLLKQQMEMEKAEIQEKYKKEVLDLGKKLEESQKEQENLRQQIDILFQERGKDSDNLRELEEDLNQLKREKESMGEINAALEKRVKEMSETIEAEKENVKKECLSSIGEIMESELQCCICNELFVKATNVNCSHTFCEYCINSWLRNNEICPMCRAVVTSQTRSLVIDTYIDKMVETLSDEIKERRKTLLQQREEEAKRAPPPRPLGQPIQACPEVITLRSVNGSYHIVQTGIRLPGSVRIVRPVHRLGNPTVPAQGPTIRVVPAHAFQPGGRGNQSRNVRPRLPTGHTVIDLTNTNSPQRRTRNGGR